MQEGRPSDGGGDLGARALEIGVRAGILPPEVARRAVEALARVATREQAAILARECGLALGAAEALLTLAQAESPAAESPTLAEALLELAREGAPPEDTPTIDGTPATIVPLPGTGEVTKGPVASSRRTVPKRLGAYELLDELGHGGMSRRART